MGAGLIALLAKGKGPSKDGPSSEPDMEAADPQDEEKEAGLEDEHLDDAFAALKSDDKMAFRDAMKAAIECCGMKSE